MWWHHFWASGSHFCISVTLWSGWTVSKLHSLLSILLSVSDSVVKNQVVETDSMTPDPYIDPFLPGRENMSAGNSTEETHGLSWKHLYKYKPYWTSSSLYLSFIVLLLQSRRDKFYAVNKQIFIKTVTNFWVMSVCTTFSSKSKVLLPNLTWCFHWTVQVSQRWTVPCHCCYSKKTKGDSHISETNAVIGSWNSNFDHHASLMKHLRVYPT